MPYADIAAARLDGGLNCTVGRQQRWRRQSLTELLAGGRGRGFAGAADDGLVQKGLPALEDRAERLSAQFLQLCQKTQK